MQGGKKSPCQRVWWFTQRRSRSSAGRSGTLSQEGSPKDGGPRTATRGLTSELTDWPAALPLLLQRVLWRRVPSSPLDGSRRSPRDRTGTARAQPGRRPPGAGRRLPGPPLLRPVVSRSGRLPPTPPALGPRLGSQDRRVPRPLPSPKREYHSCGRRPTHSPTAGHPPACSFPAFPSGVV